MRSSLAFLMAMCALHTAQASKLPPMDNSLDNEIAVNPPANANGLKYFVKISEPPSPARHTPGDVTELHCKAEGHPAPRITWLKNEMPVIEDELESNEIIESSDSSFATVMSTLIVYTASPNKEDVYTCVAESALRTAVASTTVFNDIESVPPIFSSVSSLNRHLQSAPRKPQITQHAMFLLGDAGSTLVLPCRATGNPQPQLFWHRKGQLITGDDRIKVLESGDLVFREARWSDMDSYTCTAKNEYGKDSARSFLYPVMSEKSKYGRSHN